MRLHFIPERPLRRIVASLLLTAFVWSSGRSAHAATVSYSTYFGGANYEGAYAVAVDAFGNVFVAGGTQSTNRFPTTNAFQMAYGGGYSDAFLAKYDSQGRLLFSTYFGGTSYEYVNAIALDREGDLVLVGETHSVDLLTTEDAFQYDYAGGSAFGSGDGFIAKFSPDGARLLYCSYFGGGGDERISGLAIDTNGNVCITGQTDSQNLPLKNPLQPGFGGGDSDGFIAKFDSTLTNLIFSTYLGGEDRDEDQKISIDPGGFVYVCGETLSTNFPVTAGAFQTNHIVVPQIGQNWDAFVSKLNPTGSALIYSTYMGDATSDAAFAITADADGNAYVTGAITAGWDEGTFPLGFQPTPGFGAVDAWVAKLKPDGANFEWFSYLGGSGMDVGYAIVLDTNKNIFVSGITDSHDFPVVDAPQWNFGGGLQDAFAAKISADGRRLIYSTYLGGSDGEWGYDVAVDTIGNLIAVGQSASIDFPILNAAQTNNASIRTNDSPADGYIVKLTPAVEPPPLRISRSGNNVLVSWPTNFAGFILESTAILPPMADWRTVGSAPFTFGDQFTVIQRSEVASRFFRLRRP
jgi:hypothetical protein